MKAGTRRTRRIVFLVIAFVLVIAAASDADAKTKTKGTRPIQWTGPGWYVYTTIVHLGVHHFIYKGPFKTAAECEQANRRFVQRRTRCYEFTSAPWQRGL